MKYDNTEKILFNDILTYGTFQKPWFLLSENLKDDQIIKVQMQHKYVGKPWMIAYDYYRNVYLDWVVIHFDKNKIDELCNWPQLDDDVYIPVHRVITFGV